MSNMSTTNRILKLTILTLLLVTAGLTAMIATAQDDSPEDQAETRSNSLSPTILQINYTFAGSRADLTDLNMQVAEGIAAVPGLVWKIWLMNEADQEAGGIYLFESREAALAFVNSPLVAEFAAHPSISAVNAKMFEADESLSQITRGPLSTTAQDDGETSAAENRALVAAYFDAISGKEKPTAVQEEYIADSDQALKDHIDLFEAAFPLYELIAEDVIAEGDRVAVRSTFRGTHQGEFAGIPATDRDVEIPVFLIYRIENGLIAEHWMQADVMGLMQQLGVLPVPDSSS